MSGIRIKICCISSLEEANTAVKAGADALGLVSSMPSGPGVIAESLITQIAMASPPAVATFLLTSSRNATDIIAQQKRCKTNTIQICDDPDPGTHEILRKELPGIKIVQVVHVQGEESIATAVEYAKTADAILLDSGNQKLSVKELGGTGRKHDWSISRKIRESIPVPLFLAGGLNPDNAQEAIDTVRPFGLDICSGVRSGGALDPVKLQKFFDAVRG